MRFFEKETPITDATSSIASRAIPTTARLSASSYCSMRMMLASSSTLAIRRMSDHFSAPNRSTTKPFRTTWISPCMLDDRSVHARFCVRVFARECNMAIGGRAKK